MKTNERITNIEDVRIGDYSDSGIITYVGKTLPNGDIPVCYKFVDNIYSSIMEAKEKYIFYKGTERLPKEGDEILVFDSKGNAFKRIFLFNNYNKPVCVEGGHEREYLLNKPYHMLEWLDWDWLKDTASAKPSTIEIDVKINGKHVKLSDISEETLLKIRESN
jgi:hypothetical protein